MRKLLILWSWRRDLNPRPSDYKTQPSGFYQLLRLTASYSETAVYRPLASHCVTTNFYRFLRRVPQKVPIVTITLYNLGMTNDLETRPHVGKVERAGKEIAVVDYDMQNSVTPVIRNEFLSALPAAPESLLLRMDEG